MLVVYTITDSLENDELLGVATTLKLAEKSVDRLVTSYGFNPQQLEITVWPLNHLTKKHSPARKKIR